MGYLSSAKGRRSRLSQNSSSAIRIIRLLWRQLARRWARRAFSLPKQGVKRSENPLMTKKPLAESTWFANSMIILTDPSGLDLETAGDPRTIDFGHLVHLEQGGRWKEADIGTNAIGTAIAVSEPVQIHGVEHFCSEVGVWTCAATPI